MIDEKYIKIFKSAALLIETFEQNHELFCKNMKMYAQQCYKEVHEPELKEKFKKLKIPSSLTEEFYLLGFTNVIEFILHMILNYRENSDNTVFN